MVLGSERETFIELVKTSLPLVKQEGDLQDVLNTCIDYTGLDYDVEEGNLNKLIVAGVTSRNSPIQPRDPASATSPHPAPPALLGLSCPRPCACPCPTFPLSTREESGTGGTRARARLAVG